MIFILTVHRPLKAEYVFRKDNFYLVNRWVCAQHFTHVHVLPTHIYIDQVAFITLFK